MAVAALGDLSSPPPNQKRLGLETSVEVLREFQEMLQLLSKDTPRRRRAAARHDNLDLEIPLRSGVSGIGGLE
jgi:hypothetical protein